MSNFTFRPAARKNVSLLIGLSGGTGSGKTFSGMRLAAGIAGDKPFAVIDTENGRAKHYADQFRFDHCELYAPFRPSAYTEAILAADAAHYPAVVIDSMSHSWAGEGGVLEWQEEELSRMAGDNWQKREACKMAAWVQPKMGHKAMVQRLLQIRAHLILCFRAEPKIEMVKGKDGKVEVRAKQTLTSLDGWIPICEKNLPYELTVSFLLVADKPGVPRPIKLQEQHKPLFPDGALIDEKCGQGLAAWAIGGTAQSGSEQKPTPKKQDAADPFTTMLAEFAKMKTIIGPKQYYRCLGAHGVVHANEFRKLNLARACYAEMREVAKGIAEQKESTPQGEKGG